jgi:tripeptide aminopeptidase
MLNQSTISALKLLFLEACAIDNASEKEDLIAIWVKKQIGKIGYRASIDKNNNVFFRISGKGIPLLLHAHLDSVQPAESVQPHFENGIFTSYSNTILGADDLAGVTAILTAVQYLKKTKKIHRPLDILFTTGEEIGGVGLKHFDLAKITAREGISADGNWPVGSIIKRAPAKYNFSLIFHGKGGHGKLAADNVSAIDLMAKLISTLPIGRVNSHTLLNIGTVIGGTAINAIPESAKATGEIRSSKIGDCEKLISRIKKTIEKIELNCPKGKIEFKYAMERDYYHFDYRDEIITTVKRAICIAKIKPRLIESFGVSDANTLNAMGLKIVLIGTGVRDAHTVNESIKLTDLIKLTEIVINFCRAEN